VSRGAPSPIGATVAPRGAWPPGPTRAPGLRPIPRQRHTPTFSGSTLATAASLRGHAHSRSGSRSMLRTQTSSPNAPGRSRQSFLASRRGEASGREVGASTLRCIGVTGRGYFPSTAPGGSISRESSLSRGSGNSSHSGRRNFRGLTHSDGCRIVASDRGAMSVRYAFSNRSEDILRIFCDGLDALEIPWTRPSAHQIAIYRKEATARLDAFIGPKR